MSRHAKAALAALSPLTPEQITLMQHPSMGAAILQVGLSIFTHTFRLVSETSTLVHCLTKLLVRVFLYNRHV